VFEGMKDIEDKKGRKVKMDKRGKKDRRDKMDKRDKREVIGCILVHGLASLEFLEVLMEELE